MEKNQNSFKSDYAIVPGETLREILDSFGMSRTELACRTRRPEKTISEIIADKMAITSETAFQFERALGIPASFWINLERNYQKTLTRLKEETQYHQGQQP